MTDKEIIQNNKEKAEYRGDYIFSDGWARYDLCIANPTERTNDEWDKAFFNHRLVCSWLDSHSEDRIEYDKTHRYFDILKKVEEEIKRAGCPALE